MLAEPPRAPRPGRSSSSRASSRSSGGRRAGFEGGSRGAVSGGAAGMGSSGGEAGGGATTSGGPPAGAPASPRLFVVLPKVVSQDALRQLFSKFAGMERCELKLDRASGRSKGFGYVTFASVPHAEAAIRELDGLLVTAQHRMRVMFAEAGGPPPAPAERGRPAAEGPGGGRVRPSHTSSLS